MTKQRQAKKDKIWLRRPSPKRSAIMQAVKSRDTKPELLVRAFLRAEKIKFKSYANLPGQPDIILTRRNTVVRIMGCFWHGHSCARGSRIPKTNIEYWTTKIARNVARDKRNKKDLRQLGWKVVDVWECDLRKPKWRAKLTHKLCHIPRLLQ